MVRNENSIERRNMEELKILREEMMVERRIGKEEYRKESERRR